MKIGAIFTEYELARLRARLQKIANLNTDRKVLEQCRMIRCAMNKAGRRAQRRPAPDPPGPPIEIEYNPYTKEITIKD